MKRILLSVLAVSSFLVTSQLCASEVEIVNVHFIKKGKTWTVRTTLRHNDTGWDHYADGWRVVDEEGNELGKRVLFHPHEHEQPFTRSLSGLTIPPGVQTVYIEARDNVDGWSKSRVIVDLSRSDGPGYRVSK
jgi:hypothetical protein